MQKEEGETIFTSDANSVDYAANRGMLPEECPGG